MGSVEQGRDGGGGGGGGSGGGYSWVDSLSGGRGKNILGFWLPGSQLSATLTKTLPGIKKYGAFMDLP